jgi:hypothetical protein
MSWDSCGGFGHVPRASSKPFRMAFTSYASMPISDEEDRAA